MQKLTQLLLNNPPKNGEYHSTLELMELMRMSYNTALDDAAKYAMIKESIPDEDQSDYDCEDTGYSEHSGGYIREEHYVEVSENSILKLKI